MAIIDPHTRMNPAAKEFHVALTKHVERINDPALHVNITPQGIPYLTFHAVAVSKPQGAGTHHQREALLEVLEICQSGAEIASLVSLYNQGYYAGRQDEAASDY